MQGFSKVKTHPLRLFPGRLDVPRSYTDERHAFPLTEAGVVYTPKLLVFRSPDQKSPDGRITGDPADQLRDCEF